ncbi:succinate dehydrogenase, cytochrome b556 subunit [Granulosicoccus antarcticus]|uniref:Succinate dehydrogenase cytochrome b556 subunit n=1 Tax=Granulosicoccus antarcticus IMCC3135 TaxID=1192854 RepID=A0A2Z2NRL5_9GAMM|nr:succinate dehydrogenase, cytochrome b556 subunit [Granulosicoccus antarcticus]ASJ72378.1 Succinate dehydrogenase cytochrome b556 subunit [Granulosicoccus antarcticus IMCC3135]
MAWNDTRPLSPHLQHYKLPLTAYLSVAHRAAGIINSVAIALLVLLIASAAGTPENYEFMSGIANSWFGKLAMFGFTLSLYYHMANGIRHLFWDVGHGFELETARKSGIACMAVAGVLSVITWMVALAA